MRIVATSCAALAIAAAPLAAQAAQLLVNGGFEDGPALNAQFYARGVAPDGWSAVDGYEVPDIVGVGYDQGAPPFMVLLGPHSGSRFLDTNGVTPMGGLYQDVTGLEVGSTVTLSFWVSTWAQNSAGVLNLSLIDPATNLALNGQSIGISFDNTRTSSAWFQSSFSAVVGASGAVRVLFTADSGATDRGGLGLDDMTLDGTLAATGVPEPQAWALMIAGFGLAGAAMRRRRAIA
jgi:hypothetical protein